VTSVPVPAGTPVVLPAARAALWLFGAVVIALLLYYFIGIDQGATSIFGSDTHIHELVHDGRHLLGFPCH
jgi:Probable cobalt transporter subunit (CbtB)